MTIITRR